MLATVHDAQSGQYRTIKSVLKSSTLSLPRPDLNPQTINTGLQASISIQRRLNHKVHVSSQTSQAAQLSASWLQYVYIISFERCNNDLEDLGYWALALLPKTLRSPQDAKSILV